MRPRDLVPLLRASFATSGRPVFLRALSLDAALFIVGVVVFAGRGMPPADFAALLRGSIVVRACVLVPLSLLYAPVVAPAFDAPGTRVLRSLRFPRSAYVAPIVAIFAVAVAPIVALFFAARAPIEGIATSAVVLSLAVGTRLRRRRALAFPLGVALVAAPIPAWIAAPLALSLLAFVVDRAWRSAFDSAPIAIRAPSSRRPFVALAIAAVVHLLRGARARLTIAALACSSGGLALFFALRNTPTPRPVSRALVVFSFPIAIAAATLVDPVLELAAMVRPLLRSTRTRPIVAFAAFAAAIALPTSAFAGTSSAVATMGAPSLSFAVGAWAIPIAFAIAWWGDRQRARGRGPSVFVFGVIVIAIAAMGVAW